MSSENDHRYMSAAIRLARRHQGLTGTNPSVACVLVRDDGSGAYIIGSGVTAIGGRPHAEPIALAEAGDSAKGATAYVTLEPCAHHGSTPPCAQTLIDAGVARVVTGVVDPDARVNSRGHAMLRHAGIEVAEGAGAKEARAGLAAYLNHKAKKRPYVTLKLALSADGFLGVEGRGQMAITGPIANAQSHLMRARHQAIMIGAGTLATDNPSLTCRLPGLEARSPTRVILAGKQSPDVSATVFQSAAQTRTILATSLIDAGLQAELAAFGVSIMPCDMHDGQIALPELLDDLAATGIMSLMVEGGGKLARSFLDADLVDELVLYRGNANLADAMMVGIKSPINEEVAAERYEVQETLNLGEDHMSRYTRRPQTG